MIGSRLACHPAAGYLCSTESEYAEVIAEVLGMDDETRQRLAAGARQGSIRFSDETFKAGFLEGLRPALTRLQ